ncbi:ABC transporter ATP-binding protein [Pontibacillus litoralis]|uniref:Transporter n=1 Tax=Pontibacillus litoralis JSM 072002 TaxID=1385512 RepID=A0A0A5G6E1_9BACI|nr:ABC transporter ATP-binding protein [Pontibacillus litoralis]KGX86743.1 transporter [Pontibacillus litoralis JSM 072002]
MSTVINGLTKKFNHVEALHIDEITIETGEFVAILGPSGCGKTTLMRILAGFETPTSGTVYMESQCVSDANTVVPPEKRNMSLVFQSFALWPHKTVKEHAEFPLLHDRFMKKLDKDARIARVDEILEIVGLESMGHRYPNQLSGGQRQRVALARALVAKPKLMLMDEPLSSLDAELRVEMRKEIQQIHRLTKTTILYVTHDQSEALAMADRIVVMKDGKVEQIGTPKQIYAKPETEFVATFVGKANLVHGQWEEGQFIPKYADHSVRWSDEEVAERFKDKGIFPVRPEQLELVKEGTGILGVVTSVQYQGKEIHYTVDVQGETFFVHGNLFTVFGIGDEVIIQKNK